MVHVVELKIETTDALSGDELRGVRELLDASFEDGFDDDDWDHTIGGIHVLAALEDSLVSHASVVERVLRAGDRPLRTGYVEGVATRAEDRGKGYGSLVMRAIGDIVLRSYEIGCLGTDAIDFYARLGWEIWRGPLYTQSPVGRIRTTEDEGAVMVLRTNLTRDLDPSTDLVCDWRAGDVW